MAKSNKLTASNSTAAAVKAVKSLKPGNKAAEQLQNEVIETLERKVVGIPTEAEKTKARAKAAAKPRGGKPGSAMGNQSAQYAEGELTGKPAAKAAPRVSPDKITECKNATSGDYVVVTAGGRSLPIARSKFTGQLSKIAVVGGSMKAVEAYIAEHVPQAQLARGLSGKDAPQSALAAAESRKGKAAPAPEPTKTGKTAKNAATKEAKAERKSAKVGDDQKLTHVAPNPKKAGTSTYLRYEAAYKVGRTVAEVLKHTTRADIDWDVKRGFIKLG